MGRAEETIAEIIGSSPKPRGEGVGAWFRFHILSIRSAYRSQYVCAEVGCPRNPTTLGGRPTSAYCQLHSTPQAVELRIARARGVEVRSEVIELAPWTGVPQTDLRKREKAPSPKA